jgi:hypothetical protein
LLFPFTSYQFGLDRGSNVYELEYARYEFHVMYDAFVVHRGFKEESLLHATRLKELLDNRDIFIKYFLPGLAKKYPHIVNGTVYLPGATAAATTTTTTTTTTTKLDS